MHCALAADSASITYTLGYAAPEVLADVEAGHKSHTVDPAVDVWALGVIAYELFCGRRLFDPGADISEVRARLLGSEPLPWEAGAREAGSELEGMRGLRRSVLQCLERDPSNRPTAQSLLAQWDGIFAAA